MTTKIKPMTSREAYDRLDKIRRKLSLEEGMCNSSIHRHLTARDQAAMQFLVKAGVQGILDALLIVSHKDHNTRDTPNRVSKMFVQELFAGRYTKPPELRTFPNVRKFDEQIIQGPLDVKSTCAHHFLPFIGRAWVGILPGELLPGLSKYGRIVNYYSRRPQIQEELNVQIADHLQEALKPRGVAVVIKSLHHCMACRGLEQESPTITSVMRGEYQASISLKQEFLSLIQPTL